MNDVHPPDGPDIVALVRRLTDTPNDFLRNDVDTAALVSDLLVAHGGEPLTADEAATLRPATARAAGEQRNWLAVVRVAVWLLHHPELVGATERARLVALVDGDLRTLAAHVPAGELVHDADRREELARRALRGIGLRPGGETAAQAEDRMSTLDSVERARVLEETREAERRAEEVRRIMHERAAAEAAAKASRE